MSNRRIDPERATQPAVKLFRCNLFLLIETSALKGLAPARKCMVCMPKEVLKMKCFDIFEALVGAMEEIITISANLKHQN